VAQESGCPKLRLFFPFFSISLIDRSRIAKFLFSAFCHAHPPRTLKVGAPSDPYSLQSILPSSESLFGLFRAHFSPSFFPFATLLKFPQHNPADYFRAFNEPAPPRYRSNLLESPFFSFHTIEGSFVSAPYNNCSFTLFCFSSHKRPHFRTFCCQVCYPLFPKIYFRGKGLALASKNSRSHNYFFFFFPSGPSFFSNWHFGLFLAKLIAPMVVSFCPHPSLSF